MKAAQKYLRRRTNECAPALITLCVSQENHKKNMYVHILTARLGSHDKSVVPLDLPVVIFAVRAPNWICILSVVAVRETQFHVQPDRSLFLSCHFVHTQSPSEASEYLLA